jgi:SAM-dependent methyltransferase
MQIIDRLYKEQFVPGCLGIIINPFFLARRALYLRIKSLAYHITGTVLDIGCGSKPYQFLFPCNEYVGIDIESAKARHHSKADIFFNGDLLPFESDHFDSIICTQVLEHVFEPDQFFNEIGRVLKPGGRLLLTTSFVWDEHEPPADFARYTSFGLEHLLTRHGFVVVEFHKNLDDARLLFQLMNGIIYKKIMGFPLPVRLLVTGTLIASINMAGILCFRLLPRNPDLYLDSVVLAIKD